jgi:NADH:ubiquinone oxidoreductase subunit 3 (subunit A)
MTPVDILTSPLCLAVYALALGYLVYAWSRTIAPGFRPTPDKTMPYVGGEAIAAQVCRPGYHFYYVALFFTVVHVAALVLALAPADAPLWGTLGYLAIVAVAVMALRWEQ